MMSQIDMSERPSSPSPARKRRRPALSCTHCRKRKIKCDRGCPCGQCIISKNANCVYTPSPPGKTSKQVNTAQTSSLLPIRTSITVASQGRTEGFGIDANTSSEGHSPGSSFHPGTHTEAWTPPSIDLNQEQTISYQVLLDRVQDLERQLRNSSIHAKSDISASEHASSHGLKGTILKTRFFGSSHWMYSSDIFDIAGFSEGPDSNVPVFDDNPWKSTLVGDQVMKLMQECKMLARAAKSKPYSEWLINQNFRDSVPPRNICDGLVNAYFRTSESIHRILHIPTFRKEYHRYWEDPSTMSPVFVLQMLLVMSIGTNFYQGPNADHYRQEAVKWIYSAQAWLSSPFEKGRLHISAIQLQCLLLLARQDHAVAGDLVWISAGNLLRTAIQMGLHRDPKHLPRMSCYQAEMRRRLWTTIMEMNVQSAIDSGMPLFISSKDYDTEPPTNIDDSELSDTDPHPILSHPSSTYTQTSLQLLLSQTLLTRLEVVKLSNSLNREPSYDDTIRIGSILSKSLHEITTFITLANQSSAPEHKITQIQQNLISLSIHRFILLIHRHFAAKGLKDPRFFYSRKICLETAIVMLRYPSSPPPPAPPPSYQEPQQHTILSNEPKDDYTLLTHNNKTHFKKILIHISLIIFSELYAQADTNSTPYTKESIITRDVLKQSLRDIIDLAAARIEAGENNNKGHLLLCIVMGQIEAMESGGNTQEAVLEAARKSVEFSYRVMVERSGGRGERDEVVTAQGDGGVASEWPNMGNLQDFSVDFTMLDWVVDEQNPDTWVKSGFDDGIW